MQESRRDCRTATGGQRRDSVGPTADGFETYGVTGVALISFIMLAVGDPLVQVKLLVWMFSMRVMMVLASGFSYKVSNEFRQGKYGNADKMHFEGAADAARLGHVARVGGAHLRGVLPDHSRARRRHLPLVEAVDGDHVRHAGGRHHPGARQGVHLDEVRARQGGRDVVAGGGASLNILSGLVAGNFSSYWLGLTIMA